MFGYKKMVEKEKKKIVKKIILRQEKMRQNIKIMKIFYMIHSSKKNMNNQLMLYLIFKKFEGNAMVKK